MKAMLSLRRTLAPLLLLCIGLLAPNMAGAATGPEWRDKVVALASKSFKHPAWGDSHCQRDYALARALAETDHVKLDDDVLFAAAYLHDMAGFAPWRDDKRDHSDVAADLVGSVLEGSDFPQGKLEAVRAAIRTHMFYRDPVGPEAIYLHDADALDWLGAIGVARMLALIDPQGGAPDGAAAVKTIEGYLARTPSRIVSPAGKALASSRIAEEKAFLEALRAETESLKTL